MKAFNFNEPKYEWLVYRDANFSVEIKSWCDCNEHRWNVYANIFDSHPLFDHFDAVYDLHFHGGVTYEQLIRYTPAQGIKYEWQKEHTYLKVGSDYVHLDDEWFSTQNPANGIPAEIQLDAEKLIIGLITMGQDK